MNATELVVTVRPQDVTAVPLFVRRLHAWASAHLDGLWSITLALQPGAEEVGRTLADRTLAVPVFETPKQRRQFFDRRTTATATVFLEVGPVDLDARLRPVLRHLLREEPVAPVAGELPSVDEAPSFRDEKLTRLLDRRFDRRTAVAVGGLTVAAAAGGFAVSRRGRSRSTGKGSTPTSSASASSSATSSATSTTTSCTLATELTQGPYYLDINDVRSDIREDRTGATLTLKLVVVNATTCAPISNASVDVWHADGNGLYSGFVKQSSQANGTTSSDDGTFLRGTQVTGSDGSVTFTTIVPGWYSGRTPHIHVMVHVSGKSVHTGQLFFDDSFLDSLYASTAPYSSRGTRDTRNSNDSIYKQGGAASQLVLSGSNPYATSLTMGVKV